MTTYTIALRGGATLEVKEETKNLITEFQLFRTRKERGDELGNESLLIGQGWIIDLDEVVAVVAR